MAAMWLNQSTPTDRHSGAAKRNPESRVVEFGVSHPILKSKIVLLSHRLSSGFRVPLRGPGMTGLGVIVTLLATPVANATCPQELSIYEDTNGNSLTFTPPNATQAAEHEFTLRIGTAALQGVVMMTNEPQRPEAIIMDGCPEGDVTGAELDQCTVWQGVIYGLTKDAKAPYLGKRGAPNADAILLPDVSRLVLDHTFKVALAGPAKVDDVFTMKSCQE